MNRPSPVGQKEGRSRRECCRSFTLVELLVVMGIFALLMTIAVPTFLKRSPTVAAHGALLRLKSTIALARQWAVTRRQITYVVFPEDNSSFVGAPQLAATAMRGYNIFTMEDGWLNDWQFLPVGFVFSRTHGEGENLLSTTSTSDRVFNIPFPLTNSPLHTMRCISFTPDGRLNQNGGTTLQVVFTPGTIDANAQTGAVSNYLAVTNAPAFGLRIRPLTGRQAVVEYNP